MPFRKPTVHAFHNAPYLFGIFFRKKSETMSIVRSEENIGLKLDWPGTIDHCLTGLLISFINKLRIFNYNTWHNWRVRFCGSDAPF